MVVEIKLDQHIIIDSDNGYIKIGKHKFTEDAFYSLRESNSVEFGIKKLYIVQDIVKSVMRYLTY